MSAHDAAAHTMSLKEDDDDTASNLSVDAELDAGSGKCLSVIVAPQEDSRDSDSQFLSPGEQHSPISMMELHSEPTYQTLTSMNCRLSPSGYSPTSSYATLTPLQPLPPISTMSDKFSYTHSGNVTGSFTVLQNNGLGLGLNMNVSSPYGYDKMSNLSISPPHHYSTSSHDDLVNIDIPADDASPLSPGSASAYSHNGLESPHKSLSPPPYDDSPYAPRDLVGRETLDEEPSPGLSPGLSPTLSPALSPPAVTTQATHNVIVTTLSSAPSLQVASLSCGLNGLTGSTTLTSHLPRDAVVVLSSSTPPTLVPLQQSSGLSPGSSASGGCTRPVVPLSPTPQDMEEINTKELAQQISAELKRYSIPQAIFAHSVLCRSQGTLSDLLRNPKPWSKLKSGRETFRRMWKWLQEPELQRMSALRLAAAQVPQRSTGQVKRKDDLDGSDSENTTITKKPRLVFTDLQRRTLQAIFKETKRPSKEMQVTIARQLGLEPTTVGNFFMNARRRSMDKWKDDHELEDQHMADEESSLDATGAGGSDCSLSGLHTADSL